MSKRHWHSTSVNLNHAALLTCAFLLFPGAPKGDELIFRPVLVELQRRMLDTNKKVQEAACTAFAFFAVASGNRLVPYLAPILENVMFAFKRYQLRNRFFLFEVIGEHAGADSTGVCTSRFRSNAVRMLLTARCPRECRRLSHRQRAVPRSRAASNV